MLRRRTLARSVGRPLAAGRGRAVGRPAATVSEWRILSTAVVFRARFRCQACGQRAPLDVHHVVKRSRGGSDFDLDRLVALCRRCHEWTDYPYRWGRLMITPRGRGAFVFERVWRASKWIDGGETRARYS